MSELGQTRSFGDVCSMSGLDRFSDSGRTSPEVRVVPILLQKSPMRDASCAGVEPEPLPTSRSVEATALTPSTRLQRD